MAENVKPSDGDVVNVNQTRPGSETLPLKSNVQVGYRKGGWGWLFNAAEEAEGINVIIFFFTIFTLAVGVALVARIHYGVFQLTPHGSVTSDSELCSNIGVNILKSGGNSVDSAVATAICNGVVNPHLTGLGGGGFMVIYDHRRRRVVEIIDFRETAPSLFPDPTILAVDMSIKVGVPGFLRGLYTAHSRHGSLPWKDIIEPSIHLAREGVAITESLINAKLMVKTLGNDAFGQFLAQIDRGRVLLQTRLADTLEVIADHGPDALYNGSLSTTLLSTVAANSKMTLDDLANYKSELRRALVSSVGDFTVIVPGAPSGGPLLLTVLAILGTPVTNPSWWNDKNTPDLRRLAETVRLASLYHAQLGDPDQNPDAVYNATLQMIDPREVITLRKQVEESAGASWNNWQLPEPTAGSFVGVMDNQDSYVALVSGLNSIFGAQLMSPLGFLMNDALNNFSPPGPDVTQSNNREASGKRPLSLAVPLIVVQNGAPCGLRILMGSSDAVMASQTLSRTLYGNADVAQAIEQPRISLSSSNISIESWHQQLIPDQVLAQLQGFGFKIFNMPLPYTGVNGIQKITDTFLAHADSRVQGKAISYKK